MFGIDVKKGKIREFLEFCVELANTKDEIEASRIIDLKLQGKLFSVEYLLGQHEKWAKAHPSPGAFLARGLSEFRCAMDAFATLVFEEKTFVISFAGNEKDYEISSRHSSAILMSGYGGTLKFQGNRDVITECRQNKWFEAFFFNLVKYAEGKNTPILDVPLGHCLECGIIFFGRRKDQKFCSKDHGQLWRAREAYRQKKK